VAAPELLGSMLRMNPQGYVQDLRMAQFEHAPSLCWDLMKREGIWLRGPHDATKPDGTTVLRIDYWYAHKNHQHVQSGPDPEHALLRCFVASKLGESVFVPDQMVDPT
jgi:hypothetical protein